MKKPTPKRASSKARKIRVAMVGAGGMANYVHYPSLAAFPDVKMVAVCDLDAERLNTTADRYQIEGRFHDYREMIEKTNPDAVYIVMPPHQLYDITVHCLREVHAVFIEKPPGVTADQTRNLAWHAQKHGALTMVAFNRRFIPLLREVRRRVEARGPIIMCRATFLKNTAGVEEHPYYGGATDILTCDAVHAVDMLRWMGGEVEALASDIRALYAPYPNSFLALMRFVDGAVGTLEANWVVGKRVHTFEMHARGISGFADPNTRAVIYADATLRSSRASSLRSTSNKDEGETLTAAAAAGSDDFRVYYGFEAENRHFIDCVKSGRQPETNFDDAVKTMELVSRIYAGQI